MKFLIFFFVLPFVSYAQTRLERANTASDNFRNLNFYYKGRGMAVSPDLMSLYERLNNMGLNTGELGPLYQRWGMIIQKDGKIRGLFNEPYEGMKVGVLGCVACHGGKAAGQYIVGLGNKNIDVGQIGSDAAMIMKVWGLPPRSNPKFKELHERALAFTKRLSNPLITNHTQGLVPTSLIRSWFYTIKGDPIPTDFLKGQVKVPHMWGYGEKRKTGSFWDGEGNGELGGWAIAVELYAGQTVENVREYTDKVHYAENLLGDFLPPKYPFSIDSAKAERGEKLYVQSCQKCHGNHNRDLEGLPIFDSPKHIPLRVVKTDSERLDALTDDLYDRIDSNPLNDYIQAWRRPEKGYVAQKLWGIWSRFPYLHNASVPTVYDLLSDPASRPKKFSLKNAGERERFDEQKLGLTLVTKDFVKRRLYDTTRKGSSNQGHYFESFKTLTHENKLELIEYLKTL
jgi:mono/diheme cytochrome c family protein